MSVLIGQNDLIQASDLTAVAWVSLLGVGAAATVLVTVLRSERRDKELAGAAGTLMLKNPRLVAGIDTVRGFDGRDMRTVVIRWRDGQEMTESKAISMLSPVLYRRVPARDLMVDNVEGWTYVGKKPLPAEEKTHSA